MQNAAKEKETRYQASKTRMCEPKVTNERFTNFAVNSTVRFTKSTRKYARDKGDQEAAKSRDRRGPGSVLFQ